jgi:hypothetical protein
VLKVAPKGRYVMIKGSPVDPNADFLRGGQQEVLQAAIDAGDITIVGEAYTDDWQPANAQKNMEQILTEPTTALTPWSPRTTAWRAACCGADGAGHGRHPGLGPGRRHGRAEPRGARHADGVGLEGQPGAGQGRGRNRRGAGRRHGDG